VLGAERLLAGRQRALEQRPRPGEIALGLQQERALGTRVMSRRTWQFALITGGIR
jgi:hypothetical protein